jgi:broad specificity phosphatase PhoE
MHETAVLQLYIVRHGETPRNLEDHLVQGQNTGTPLNKTGIGQAIELGQDFAAVGIRPHAAYVSPALRAQQTGLYSLRAMGSELELQLNEGLHEMSQGEWQGRRRDEVYTPECIRQILADPEGFAAPGGESVGEVRWRKLSFLGLVAREHYQADQPRTIVAYGHGLATRILAGYMLGWPVEKMRDGAITPNGSVSLFTFDGQNWATTYIGRQSVELRNGGR